MVSDAYDKLEQELRRGVVVLAVLSQLRTLRYGYELRQSLVDRQLPIEEGTLYPLLRRLEAQGVLSSEWRTTQGPPRRYYVLSAEGTDLYQRLTASWRGLNKAMDHLLEGEQCDDR
jgi:DNA-binding PadR family transcriptional regulator